MAFLRVNSLDYWMGVMEYTFEYYLHILSDYFGYILLESGGIHLPQWVNGLLDCFKWFTDATALMQSGKA
jgi:hypothetical protein